MAIEPIIITGSLGWGNDQPRPRRFDAYGPGGRWGTADRPTPRGHGDHLADALEDAGAGEGARLVVVALPRGCVITPKVAGTIAGEVLDAVEEAGR